MKTSVVSVPKSPALSDKRLASLDAYRGLTMLLMAFGGISAFTMTGLSKDFWFNHPTWGGLTRQLDHREWEGCTVWDLIQPSFMFIVGVAMPFAFASRRSRGESWGRQFLHVCQRCLLLAAVGIFLDCYSEQKIYFQFIRVLQQIALGYFAAFLVLHLGPVVQAVTAAVILVLHPLAFTLYAQRQGGVDPWLKGDNLGVFVDKWLDGRLRDLSAWLQPASQADAWLVNAWKYLDQWLHLPLSAGGYVTLNAWTSTATILIGVLCGELLRGKSSQAVKLAVLSAAGVAGLAAGLAVEKWVPIPMVKRLWTTSFALYAGGWTCLFMAAMYYLVDVLPLRRLAFPLTVVGMNSIAMYVFTGLFGGNIQRGLLPFLKLPGLDEVSQAVVVAVAVIFVKWLFCYWLYRHRIFIKL
jgi:predicted acyltransferase